LIIGAEKLSKIVDWTDRTTCILFGDGAGAAVVSAGEENEIIDVHTAADGNYANLLITPGGEEKFIKMSGNEVFKIAVQTLTKDVVDILEKNQISSDKIDLFIPHQANLRIIEAVKQRLNFTNEQCVVTVGKYGNTSSASIPMAMNDAYEEGRLKKGDLLLLDAFGGGFTWGSALLKFGGETANNF
jgi:3-oxoacyl-[acyl-carrier-protein] synthase 3